MRHGGLRPAAGLALRQCDNDCPQRTGIQSSGRTSLRGGTERTFQPKTARLKQSSVLRYLACSSLLISTSAPSLPSHGVGLGGTPPTARGAGPAGEKVA